MESLDLRSTIVRESIGGHKVELVECPKLLRRVCPKKLVNSSNNDNWTNWSSQTSKCQKDPDLSLPFV